MAESPEFDGRSKISKARETRLPALLHNGTAEADMAATIDVRRAGDVAILDLGGNITLGEGSGLIRNGIRELVMAGERKILLNLHDVTYIDSAGLGEIAGSYSTLMNLGGQVKLLHPRGKVNDMLAVTKLYTVLMSFTDEADALRSFQAESGKA
jgi:anti-sigma B factor antagonist